MKKYRFIREDNGKPVDVDFEAMMGQDAAGFITLPDGVAAKRSYKSDMMSEKRQRESDGGGCGPIPASDAMGFTVRQLAEFEADRTLHGFTGVEFTQDPHEPTFYQVRCSSRREWERYVKHRGMTDNNHTCGVSISYADIERAKRRVAVK